MKQFLFYFISDTVGVKKNTFDTWQYGPGQLEKHPPQIIDVDSI